MHAVSPSHEACLQALQSELHVWLARQADMSTLADREHILSEEERIRSRGFRDHGDRDRFLTGRLLVRRALSRYADALPSAWRFTAGAHGKPEILSPGLPYRLRFNLSHTEGLAACVVTLDGDCGIDVEQTSRQCDMQAIARRMFAPAEQAALGQLEGECYRERFFVLWTLREAWGKALGRGLARTPAGIRIESGRGGEYTLYDDGRAQPLDEWQLAVQFPTDAHVLALAVRSGHQAQRRVVCSWIEP